MILWAGDTAAHYNISLDQKAMFDVGSMAFNEVVN